MSFRTDISEPDPRASKTARTALAGALTLALMLAAAGCGPGDGADSAEPLRVRDVWVNLVPGGMGAVYLEIVNPRAEGDRLTAVETEAAKAAEIHETVREGGLMRMVAHPDGFEIPPRSTVVLAPGGKHVMLIEPRPDADGTLQLTLRFEKAGDLVFDAPVRTMGSTNDSNHDEEER